MRQNHESVINFEEDFVSTKCVAIIKAIVKLEKKIPFCDQVKFVKSICDLRDD